MTVVDAPRAIGAILVDGSTYRVAGVEWSHPITPAQLVAIARHELRRAQSSPRACEERARAIAHLDEALLWLAAMAER